MPVTGATDPAIAVDEDDFIVTAWVDERDGRRRIFRQIYDFNLVRSGGNWSISRSIHEFAISPTVAASSNAAWFAWCAPDESGRNVYAAQVSYMWVDVDDDERPETLPGQYQLGQNYPNPFNPTTTIAFTLPQRERIRIDIYDILGRRVANIADDIYEAGTHSVTWDGRDADGKAVAAGVYFYELKGSAFQTTKKMLLIK